MCSTAAADIMGGVATCCSWSKVDVPGSRTYVMTAGTYITACKLGLSYILSWTPQMACCTWNVNFAVPAANAQYNKCTTVPWKAGNIGCP